MQYRNTRVVYGSHFQQIAELRVLVVGVGGIGCEILKCLGKLPVKQVDIADLDTIEVGVQGNADFESEQAVPVPAGAPRGVEVSDGAGVPAAAESLVADNGPPLQHPGQEPRILQAVQPGDNGPGQHRGAVRECRLSTFVNQICVSLSIPAVDAGTTGYLGQVAVILPHQTKCYSCEKKMTPEQTFPVCTIRRRPDKPIHCIVWAKFVFEMLFGLENSAEANEMTDLQQFAHEIRKKGFGQEGIQKLTHHLFLKSVQEVLSEKEKQGGVVQLIPEEELSKNQKLSNPIDKLPVEQLSNVQPISHYIQSFKEATRLLAHRLSEGQPGMAF